jgi:cell division protein FtsL
MKNDNVKKLEEKLTKAKTSQKDIDRNIVELQRVVKDAKNPKLGNALLAKSKSL